MLKKLKNISFSTIIGAIKTKPSGIFRVLDQGNYDDVAKNGTCFLVSAVSAIEAKTKQKITEREIESFYEMGEELFGTFKKAKQVLSLLSLRALGGVRAKNLRSLPTKNITYKQFENFVRSTDCCIVSFHASSPFYSSMTGKFYQSNKIGSYHAVRVFYGENGICLVNSYGLGWAKGGFVAVSKEQFDSWKIYDVCGCDLK